MLKDTFRPVALMLKRTMCRNTLDIPSKFVCSTMHLKSDLVVVVVVVVVYLLTHNLQVYSLGVHLGL